MTTEKERAIENLVKNEVYCCATDIVEYILKASETVEDAPFSYDDVEYGHKDNSDEIDELQEKLDRLEEAEPEEPEQGKTETDEEFDIRWDAWEKEWNKWEEERDNLQYKINDLEDEQNEIPEVYEWWEVDSRLADDLYDLGETVIRGWHSYWGRSCTGQAISMDYVMEQVYDRIHSA